MGPLVISEVTQKTLTPDTDIAFWDRSVSSKPKNPLEKGGSGGFGGGEEPFGSPRYMISGPGGRVVFPSDVYVGGFDLSKTRFGRLVSRAEGFWQG